MAPRPTAPLLSRLTRHVPAGPQRVAGVSVALLALAALGALPARLQAQTVDVSVVWQSDYTPPGASTTSRSGTIAGPANVNVLFTGPSDCIGAVIKKLIIHERDGHVPDPAGTGDNLNLPMTHPTSTTWQGGVHWETHAGHHKSPYDITVQVTYTVMTYFPPPPHSTQIVTGDTAITVTPSNLEVNAASPANPEPILWDPDTMTSKTLTATASCGYKEAQPVTVTIYTSSQVPVRTLTVQPTPIVGPGDTQVQVAWDGSQDPPATGVAPKGVYLFKWSVGGIAQMPPTTDTDKSAFVTVATSVGGAELVSDDGTTAIYWMSYTLTSTPSRRASAAHIDVYDSLLNLVATRELAGQELEPGHHTVLLSFPSPQVAGTLAFMVSAQDQHSDCDRGHRQRWALQHNGTSPLPAAIGYAHSNFTSEVRSFAGFVEGIGYKQLPDVRSARATFNTSYAHPYLEQVRVPLEDPRSWPNPTSFFSPKRLRVLFFSGHADDPYAVLLDGPQGHSSGSGSQRIPTTQQFYTSYRDSAAPNWPRSQNCLMVETIRPGTTPLSTIRMAILSACSVDPDLLPNQVPGMGPSLADQLCSLGVWYTIAIGWYHMNAQGSDLFLDGYLYPYLSGKADDQGRTYAPMTVRQAFLKARVQINEDYPLSRQLFNNPEHRFFAHARYRTGWDEPLSPPGPDR